MSRSKTYNKSSLIEAARDCFWQRGYYASSIHDLVSATGVSRHGLYAEFGNKRGLFIAAIQNYVDQIVTPAFTVVEQQGAGLPEIRQYLEHQISLAETAGLPGPGCLIANTMVESGPHEQDFQPLVNAHLKRLDKGFENALRNSDLDCLSRKHIDSSNQVERLARFLTISSQGLWSVSRACADSKQLYEYVDVLLKQLEDLQK